MVDIPRQARIAALKQHPAWADLCADIQETHDRYATALAKTMLATGEPFPDFEFKRGYLAGMKAVTQKPDQATAAVRKDAAKREEEPVE